MSEINPEITKLEKYLSTYRGLVEQIADCNTRRNAVSDQLAAITDEHAELLRRKADAQAKLDLQITALTGVKITVTNIDTSQQV